MRPTELSDNDRIAWLRLARTPSVGPATFRQLIDRFRTAQAALDALPRLARAGGRLFPPQPPSVGDARRQLEQVATLGARLVALCEAGYPAPLRHIHDPPPLLCMRGTPELAARPVVGIVGARNASAGGRRLARTMAAELGRVGFVVASGLARGIDTAAHEGALEAGTIAAVAGGLDICYPPENADLQRAIAETGLLVSEMPPGTRPQARHFPRRNRLISGVSLGVLVVEAAERSGSLITARFALEQGRDVFAVPGSPLDPRASGTNRLIRDGALLTASADDIVAALLPQIECIRVKGSRRAEDCTPGPASAIADAEPAEPLTAGTRTEVAALLSPAPTAVDTLIQESGLDAATVQTILLELDLAGRLRRDPGGRVALR